MDEGRKEGPSFGKKEQQGPLCRLTLPGRLSVSVRPPLIARLVALPKLRSECSTNWLGSGKPLSLSSPLTWHSYSFNDSFAKFVSAVPRRTTANPRWSVTRRKRVMRMFAHDEGVSICIKDDTKQIR